MSRKLKIIICICISLIITFIIYIVIHDIKVRKYQKEMLENSLFNNDRHTYNRNNQHVK